LNTWKSTKKKMSEKKTTKHPSHPLRRTKKFKKLDALLRKATIPKQMKEERAVPKRGRIDAPPVPKVKFNTPDPAKLRACWERGVLAYKLRDHQKPLYASMQEALKNPDCLKYVVNSSRRFGKSTVAAIIALEFCIRNTEAQVWLTAPTLKMLSTITLPIIRMLVKDCPLDLTPHWTENTNTFEFASGSVLHLVGTDMKRFEYLRGQTSHLNIIDEAAFSTGLDYFVNSVMIPQTMTTKGTTILLSTPPLSPAHDFFDMVVQAKAEGYYSCYTIEDNTSLTEKQRNRFIKEAGGLKSTTYLREYMCRFVTDQDMAIIPEWDKTKYMWTGAPNDNCYRYWRKYVSMDIGVVDLSAVLYGYYNFKEARLYIEAEDRMNGPEMTTSLLAEMIRDREKKLWPGIKPHVRVADNDNVLLLQSLTADYRLEFFPTSKDTLDSMVNKLRIFVKEGRLRVHESCEYLLSCLESGLWQETKGVGKRRFGQNKVFGHWDHLSSLIYMVRNIDEYDNPLPEQSFNPSMYFIPEDDQEEEFSKDHMALKSLLGD